MSHPASTTVPCPHVLRLPVLGVETAFATNAPEVLGLVREAWGWWDALLETPDVVTPSPTVVRILVGPTLPGGGGRASAWQGTRWGGGGSGHSAAAHHPNPPDADPGAWSRGATGAAVPLGTGRSTPGGSGVRDPVVRSALLDPGAWPQPRVANATTLRIGGPGGVAVADTRRLEALARVTGAAISRPDAFVEGWLEPLTLFLLGAQDRQPLHAAAVVGHQQDPRTAHQGPERPGAASGAGAPYQQDPRTAHEGAERPGAATGAGAPHQQDPGTPHPPIRETGTEAILLAGPSGTGKSTLTYAAWRSGRFRVLADEPVYVQLRPRFRVWGRRARLHLPTGARAWFPELRGVAATALPTGKTKIVVEAAGHARPWAERAGLCLLTRSAEDRPHLDPVPVERAVAELTADLDPGYDLFADTIDERIAHVAEGGAWRLHLGNDPEAAVPLLDEVVERVGGSG